MRQVYLQIPNPIWLYPWGNAWQVFKRGIEIANDKAHGLGIGVEFVVSQTHGIPVRTMEIYLGYRAGYGHVHARGMTKGTVIWLHSGWIGAGHGNKQQSQYYYAPFKDAEAVGQCVCHEFGHILWGTQHSPDRSCLMHSGSTSWWCTSEVQRMQQRFGKITPPKPETVEEFLKKRKQAQWYKLKRAADARTAQQTIVKEAESKLADLTDEWKLRRTEYNETKDLIESLTPQELAEPVDPNDWPQEKYQSQLRHSVNLNPLEHYAEPIEMEALGIPSHCSQEVWQNFSMSEQEVLMTGPIEPDKNGNETFFNQPVSRYAGLEGVTCAEVLC